MWNWFNNLWQQKKPKKIVPFDFTNDSFLTLGATIKWDEFIKDSKQNYTELLRSFNTLAEVASPLYFWAENSGKVKFKTYIKKPNDELEEVTDPNDSLNKLLLNPNDFLGWNEFKSNNLINLKLFGNCYIDFIGSDVSTKTPTKMFLLPPQNMQIKLKGVNKLDKYNGDFREAEIEKYAFVLNHQQKVSKSLEVEEVLHLRTTNPNYDNGSFLFGQSPLVSAQYAINAIHSGYSAKVGLYKNGAKTILSLNPGNNNEFGSMELPNETDIQTEQDRLSRYGIEEGQWQTIISKFPLNASRVSYNVNELQINENNIRDFQTVCAAIGIDSRMLGDPSSSTFANQEEATKKFYQGTFKAFENGWFEDFTKKIQSYAAWYNRVIKPDFSEIPELAEAEKDIQELLMPDVEKGLITRAEYLRRSGKLTDDIPKEYYEYYIYNNGMWLPINETS